MPEILVRLNAPSAVVRLRSRLGALSARLVVEPALSTAALRLLSGEPEASRVAAELGLSFPERFTNTRLYDGRPRIVILDLLADITTKALVAPSGAPSIPAPEEGLAEESAAKLLRRGYEHRWMAPAETEANLRAIWPLIKRHPATRGIVCNLFAASGGGEGPTLSRRRLEEYNRMLIGFSADTGVRIAQIHSGLIQYPASCHHNDFRCRATAAADVVAQEILLALGGPPAGGTPRAASDE